MDIHTINSLELLENQRNKERLGSLLWLLDKCQTAMGSREVKKWITRPLIDKNEIEKRYEIVESLINNFELRESMYNRFQLNAIRGLLRKDNVSNWDICT